MGRARVLRLVGAVLVLLGDVVPVQSSARADPLRNAAQRKKTTLVPPGGCNEAERRPD